MKLVALDAVEREVREIFGDVVVAGDVDDL